MHKTGADLPRRSACWSSSRATTRARPRGRDAGRALEARYVTRTRCPSDVLDSERRIAEATAREEGKPEAALGKITEGRVNGFLKDVVLLEQPSVQDNKKTVKALLDDAGVTITRFARFEVGEG
jgi:elongation factor Ts